MQGRPLGRLIWKIGDAVVLFLSKTLIKPPSKWISWLCRLLPPCYVNGTGRRFAAVPAVGALLSFTIQRCTQNFSLSFFNLLLLLPTIHFWCSILKYVQGAGACICVEFVIVVCALRHVKTGINQKHPKMLRTECSFVSENYRYSCLTRLTNQAFFCRSHGTARTAECWCWCCYWQLPLRKAMTMY